MFIRQKSNDTFCIVRGSPSDPGEELTAAISREEANAQLRTLLAAENAIADIPALTESDFEAARVLLAHYSSGDPASHAHRKGSRVRLYLAEDEAAPDGRYIDPGSINFNRQPPFPFRIQTKQPESDGHAGAELAGVLTNYAVVPKPDGSPGNVVVVEGRLDMKSDAGKLAERLMREGFLQTWSPELGDVYWNAEVTEMNEEGQPTRVTEHVTSAVFLGGTAVALPAMASAVMELLDDDGEVVTPALVRGIAASSNGIYIGGQVATGGMITSTQPYYVGDGTPELFIPAISGNIVSSNTVKFILACVPADAPPSSHFSNPELAEPQRWTSITDDGRVSGHCALEFECHIGHRSRCVTISEIADYAGRGNFEYANGVGYVITAEGTQVGTGPLAVIGGHASEKLGWSDATAYYKDDPANIVADVVYGRDQFGIWFSGALRTTATREQVYALRANGVSLDARDIDGELRFLAACCVCKPGYPKIAARFTAASMDAEHPRILSLVAAGGPPEPNLNDDFDCGCDDDTEFDDLEFRVLTTRIAGV